MAINTQRTNTTKRFKLVVQRIEYYGLQQDPLILPLFRAFAYNRENNRLYKTLMDTISNRPTVKTKRLQNIPFHTPTPEQETPESIRIGQDELKRPYCLSISEIIKVVLVAGKIGMGKTSAILNLLLELAKRGIRWHAIDHKRDTRGISRELKKHNPIVFLRFSTNKCNFRYNPLQQIPGIPTRESDFIFSNLLAESCFLLQGSSFMILQHIKKIRNEKKNPTIKDLIASLEAATKYKTFREQEWRASSLRALISLQSSFPDMLNVEQGINIVDVFNNYNTVSEVDNAGLFRNLWATFPTALTHKFCINQDIRGDKAPIDITIMDEANFGFSKKALDHCIGAMPTLASLLETGREFNLGWIIATNRPADMIDSVKVNASTRMLLYLGDWKNVSDMSSSMELNRTQTSHTATFTPGDAIIKREGQRSHQIKLDELRAKKEIVSDEETEATSKPILDKYPIVLPQTNNESEQKSTLSPLEREMLLHIKENMIPKSEHAEKLGWGRSKADTIFKNLSDLYIGKEIPTGKKGPRPKYLILKKQAYEELGIPYESTRGAGEVHDWLISFYKAQLESNGFTTKTSLKINDSKEIDLAILESEHKIGIEISDTTTVQFEIEEAVKSLKEFHSIIIIATNKSKTDRLKEKIQQQPPATQQRIQATYLINNLIPTIKEILP